MIVFKTFLEYEQDQIKEIERYIWIKGVELKHDPRCSCSNNDLYSEWILRYAQEYRDTHIVAAQIKDFLIKKAKKQTGGDITPCSGHKDFDLTYETHVKTYMLWYNDKSGSTFVVTLKKDN